MNKIPRNSSQHPLSGQIVQPQTADEANEVRRQNVARIGKIRVMSPQKAQALGQAFDTLQRENIETVNKAKVLLHQNQQMHQMLHVLRNIAVVGEQIVDSKHLTEIQYAELAGHVRFMPPLEVIDQMLRLYDN